MNEKKLEVQVYHHDHIQDNLWAKCPLPWAETQPVLHSSWLMSAHL